jgi:hypothetical protein
MKMRRAALAGLVAILGSQAAGEDLNRLYRLESPILRGLAEVECVPNPDVKGQVQAVMRVPLQPPWTSFGGIRAADGGVLTAKACPVGILIRSEEARCELFAGLRADPKLGDPKPGYLAYAAGSKATVRELKEGGTASLDGMSEPWVVLWGGALPTLLLAQQPLLSVERTPDRLRLAFAGKVGTALFMLPYGQFKRHGTGASGMGIAERAFRPDHFSRALRTRPETEWKDGLPNEVVAYARDWTRRLRRIPVEVSESYAIADGAVRLTESFTYQDIDDAWNTPKAPWAVLPPIFALSKAMGGPVSVEGQPQELPWLCPLGPLTVLDGSDKVAFSIRIPKLNDYLFGKVAPPTEAAARNPKFVVLRDKLRAEIDKVLAVGEHMAPFRNLGTGGGSNWHWANPAETVIALAWALPYLAPDKAEALRAYLRKEAEAYDPLKVSFAPRGVGARREFYEPVREPKGGGSKEPNLLNVYAAWEYVDKVAGPHAVKTLWPDAKHYLEGSLVDFRWDSGEQRQRVVSLRGMPQPTLNARLAGYVGYTRLARLAGDKEAEALGTCLLSRGLAILHAQAWYHQFLIERGYADPLPNLPPGFLGTSEAYKAHLLPHFHTEGLLFNQGMYGTAWPYIFFLDLTPEVGAFLRDHAREPVTATVRWMNWRCPALWLNRGLKPFASSQGENWVLEPYIPWVNFLALATVVQPPPDELAWYVGDSRARFGDLYYIQRLALALRALASQRGS